MITIIDPGTIRKRKCDKCGCLFTYESEDEKVKTYDTVCPISYRTIINYVRCPQCEYKIILNEVCTR